MHAKDKKTKQKPGKEMGITPGIGQSEKAAQKEVAGNEDV